MYTTSLTTTEPVEHAKTVVHKLDKKFLPDDVGGGVFKVNVSYDETNSAWASDKTFSEIMAAEKAKTPIIGTFTDQRGLVFTLVGCDVVVDEGHCKLAAFDVEARQAPKIYQIKVYESRVTATELKLTATATDLT